VNWLDILILAAIAGGALYGLKKGLVRLMLSLLGVVSGVILAGKNYQSLAEAMTFVKEPGLQNLIAYFVIFFAVFFIAGVAGEMLHTASGLLVFGCFDQVGGTALGAVVAALVIQAAFLPLARFPLGPVQQALSNSELAPFFISTVPILLALLPPEFDAVRRFFQPTG
jgi:membrane protein required for colicin V production